MYCAEVLQRGSQGRILYDRPTTRMSNMRVYVLTTGVIFALLAVAHVFRMVAERHTLATDPWFLIITLVAALLSVWAFMVARRLPKE